MIIVIIIIGTVRTRSRKSSAGSSKQADKFRDTAFSISDSTNSLSL
jgi:hypothetical protein